MGDIGCSLKCKYNHFGTFYADLGPKYMWNTLLVF